MPRKDPAKGRYWTTFDGQHATRAETRELHGKTGIFVFGDLNKPHRVPFYNGRPDFSGYCMANTAHAMASEIDGPSRAAIQDMQRGDIHVAGGGDPTGDLASLGTTVHAYEAWRKKIRELQASPAYQKAVEAYKDKRSKLPAGLPIRIDVVAPAE